MADQFTIPRLGFGTYGRREEAGIEAILYALEVGYRHLDTAQTYDTEHEVGEALRRSGLGRPDVFVTTKISVDNYVQGALLPSLQKSLDTLALDQVDLTLLHWPSPNGKQPLAEYLLPLVEAQERGLTKWIGVSNFTIALLEEAERLAGPGRIVNNQFELNPFMQNDKLATYCQEKGIFVTCYQPIAKGRLGDDPVLSRLAQEHGASVEQLALAWELAKGYGAIPTSSRKDRIESNFKALDLKLSPQDMAAIAARNRNARAIDPEWGPDWD